MTNQKNQPNAQSQQPIWRQFSKSALAHVELGMHENVLVTHEHLRKLRECAEIMRETKSNKLFVVATRNNPQVKFLVKTLIHLGVSCGKIECIVDAHGGKHIEIFVLP